MSKQSEVIVQKVQNKLQEAFGETFSQALSLAVAKELGLVQGKRGRTGGTFATESGLRYADLVSEMSEGLATETLEAEEFSAHKE